MKGRKRMLLLAAIGLLFLKAAWAETGPDLGMGDPYDYSPLTVTWRDMNVSRDTKLPVYSAPFEDAWRGAGGKAAVNVNEPFFLLGTVGGGEWGLVDYQVDGESRRIGWIRMPDGAAQPSEYGDMWLNRTPLRVNRNVAMTDDTGSGGRKIRTVKAGEQVTGMFVYAAKGQVCIETKHEGKTVWGLIPADAVQDMTDTFLATEGDTLVIREGVTIIGSVHRSRYIPEEQKNLTVTCVLPGDIAVGTLDLYVLGGAGIRRVEMPGSLRQIGMEGISSGKLDELRLSGNLDVDEDAFYAAQFDRIILAADYTGPIPDGQYMRVREWRAEEGNPEYSDIDGVLFSADGKRLLRYPNNRPDDHYDVPAGTEEIADRAFTDDSMDISLRSVSLPTGLRKIGQNAFSGCGYLLSMAVPLTVTEVASSAFANCVSLERLSLPPGMTAEIGDWVRREDFSSAFRGDNWGTYAKPAEKPEWEAEYEDSFRSYPIWLDDREGSKTVPVYSTPTAEALSGTEKAGSEEYVFGIRNGRANIGEDRWVNLENTLNRTWDEFFRITGGEPADPARRITAAGTPLQFSGVWDGMAHFYTMEGGDYHSFSFPIRETLLYRERTGDGQRMGIIMPEGDSAALLEEPGGEETGHLYAETQARILEEKDGWIRTETVYGTGWIAQDELAAVAEEPETAQR